MLVVVFLDIDGVVRPVGGKTLPFEPDCLKALASALAGLEVELVIASSWKEQHFIGDLREFFGELTPLIVGTTPAVPISNQQWARLEEALAWLEEYRPQSPWVAIDDDPQNYPVDYVFLTNPENGFSLDDIQPFRGMVVRRQKHHS
ncbi:MAG: hypothetical protein GXP14_16415 [Gammaproteobacteria bacterium]|nr:hypothetical protein [Gammaproteobacteria bacterium]